jgi:site-specific DNA-methyltransferase (adenine-specific)
MAMLDNLTTQVNLAWDKAELESISDQVEGFDVGDFGFEVDDLPQVVMPTDKQGEGESKPQTEVKEDDFDPDAQYETKVKAGEVWQLGEHRLMCGDSLSEEDVLKLLNGEHAPLTFTDPPYRLATQGGGVLKTANSMKQIKENGVDEFEPLKLKLYSETNIYSHNKPLIKDYILLAERENKPYDLAIYKKQGLPNYAGHLMTDLEYIAVIGDQGPKKGLDFETYSKLYVGKKDADNELSYSKPVALCGKFIMLYSDKGDIVLDIFGGSGSTMIACEQLGRKCRMMELDPHYCTVIIARWEKLTGQKAIKLNQ